MSPLGWAFLAVLCSAFSAAIVYLLMRSRAEVLLSKQREEWVLVTQARNNGVHIISLREFLESIGYRTP